jgi:hypothetical protein
MTILPQTPTRHRTGCFSGCLRIVGVLVLGCVLVLALFAIFQPWGFYLGGRFHPSSVLAGLGHDSCAGRGLRGVSEYESVDEGRAEGFACNH